MCPILYESTDLLFKPLTPQNLQNQLNAFMLSKAFGSYAEAEAEANRIEAEARIPMTVESLKPVHFGWGQYGVMPRGDFMCSLKKNTAFYPVGVWSVDPNFDAIKWYRGAKTEYLCDWMTAFVHLLEEKQQVMFPQPTFKGMETFTMTIVAPAAVQAWLIAYVVLPETMLEQSICQ